MKKILLAFLITASTFGAISSDKQYKLDHALGAVGIETKVGTLIAEGGQTGLARDGHQSRQVLVGTYDFAVSGGASGASIHLGVSLPAKAVISNVYFDTITPLVSSGASIEVSALARGDIKNPVAHTVFNVANTQVAGQSIGTAATMKKINATTERGVYFGIGVAAVTAGKLKLFIEYVVSQ